MSESRREELAREDIEIGMEDPYWLCNLHGRINHDDVDRMVKQLREDADLIESAHQKIKDDEWTAGEAALHIANNANFGDYDARSTVEEIQKEVEEEADNQ